MKYDKGLEELLKLFTSRPDLVKEIIFEPNNCAKLLAELRSGAARDSLSQPVQDFLGYVAGGQDGYAIAACFGGTSQACAKGTAYGLCGGNTGGNRS